MRSMADTGTASRSMLKSAIGRPLIRTAARREPRTYGRCKLKLLYANWPAIRSHTLRAPESSISLRSIADTGRRPRRNEDQSRPSIESINPDSRGPSTCNGIRLGHSASCPDREYLSKAFRLFSFSTADGAVMPGG